MAGAQEIDISYDPDTGAFVSGLLSRVKWDSLNVSYGIPWDQAFYGSDYVRTVDPPGDTVGPTEVDETNGFVPLNALQVEAFEAAVREVMALTNLVLTRNTIDPGQTDIRVGMTNTPAPEDTIANPMPNQWTAYAYGPSDDWIGGEIWFDTADYLDPTPGSYAYQTFFHEFGHALGLKHGHEPKATAPTNPNILPAGFDSLEFSTMTYSSYVGENLDGYQVRPGDYPMTYMLADIAALQYMYGANFNTNAGPTVYRFSSTTGQVSINGAVQEAAASQAGTVTNTLFRTIWDGGGTDTYDFSLYTTPLDVNLAPGLWSDVDRTSNLQAARLDWWNPVTPAGTFARGQVFNALLYYGNPASLIENAIGGSNADILRGNFGANTLEGRGANDTLDGDAGDDWLDGGFGDDVLEGRGGNDTLVGDTGIDTADYRRATVGVNATLNQPNGYAAGGIPGGNDILIGIEKLWGSVHRDVFYGDAGANTLWGWEGNDWLGGQGGADLLQGDAGDDSLQGGEGDDILEGGVGNDTLEGGGGYNTYYGGIGNDVIRSGAAEEVLDGGDGFDIADYSGSPTRILIDLRIGTGKFYGGDAFGDSFVSIEAIQGSAHDDVMNGSDTAGDIASGGSGNDSFVGHGGDDVLSGQDDADTLIGGAGNDWLDGGDGDDVLIGGAGADTIRGGDGFDVVSFEGNGLWIDLNSAGGGDVLSGVEGAAGTAGNDTVFGTAAGNFILGLAGDDELHGGFGADTLQGGDGWDFHDGGEGPDLVSYRDRAEGRGINLGFDRGDGTYGKVSGSDSGDTFVSIEDVEGTQFNDTIAGNAGFNVLYGLDGDDELRSDDGDALWGGRHNDSFITNGLAYVYGEEGRDSVVFTGTSGAVGVNLANQSLNSGAAQFGRFFGIETFYGTAANDTFAGGSDPVALYGLTGSDILWGGSADDTLGGGAANDHMDGGFGFDVVDYAGDTAGVLVDLRAFVAAYGDAAGDTVWGMEGVSGGSGHDSLGGTDFANRLWGAGGNDYMAGYGDVDAIWGGDGADSIDAGSGADYVDGGDGNDLIGDNEQVVLRFATDDSAADTLLGGEGADTLLALSGSDLLDGGSGADSMAGGVGDDSYVVDDPGDVVSESDGAGADTIYASLDIALPEHVETLAMAGPALAGTGNAAANTLSGTVAANLLRGLAGTDTLYGGLGADTLDGAMDLAADWLFGGLNDDVYLVAELGDLVLEEAGGGFDRVVASLSWTLGAHVEALKLTVATGATGTGNTEDNLIEGDAGPDSLNGHAGADTLTGGAGQDNLAGGADNDAYVVDEAGDRIIETRTSGADTVYSPISWTLGAHQEDLVLTGDAAIDGTGNGLNNVITSNDAANVLLGGGRADTLAGGGGNDLYLIDATDVLIEQAGGGHDTVVANASFTLSDHIEVLRFNGTANVRGDGNAENNFILGNIGNNRLLGHDGNDTLNGGLGNDTLQGGEGADSLVGGDGVDRLDGGNGDDTYALSDADLVVELVNAGIDTVLSSVSYTLPANVENLSLVGTGDIAGIGNALDNVLVGNGGANLLRGLGGHDRLSGGQAGDTLEGGLGADTLTGSGGLDRFLWLTPAEGGDTVVDFRPGEDKLAFLAGGFGGLAGVTLSQNAAADAVAQFVYTKTTGVLEWDADGTGASTAVIMATLSNKPTLAVTDVVIVA